jgi:hypothetical protein
MYLEVMECNFSFDYFKCWLRFGLSKIDMFFISLNIRFHLTAGYFLLLAPQEVTKKEGAPMS